MASEPREPLGLAVRPRGPVTSAKIEELFRAISREIDSPAVVIEMRNNSGEGGCFVIFSPDSELVIGRFAEQTWLELIAKCFGLRRRRGPNSQVKLVYG